MTRILPWELESLGQTINFRCLGADWDEMCVVITSLELSPQTLSLIMLGKLVSVFEDTLLASYVYLPSASGWHYDRWSWAGNDRRGVIQIVTWSGGTNGQRDLWLCRLHGLWGTIYW